MPDLSPQLTPAGPLMAARFLRVSSLAAAAVASCGIYLHNRQLDLSDLSVIRFGRAAAAVSYSTLTVSDLSMGTCWRSRSFCIILYPIR